jgi:DNA-directed RNA polymerase specialized sigma24 family protein
MTEAYAKRQEYISARASPRQWVHGFIVNYVRNYRRNQYRAKGLFVKTTRDLADETPSAADQYEVERNVTACMRSSFRRSNPTTSRS